MNFKRNLAVVIGINQYQNGINPLQTAVPDAQKLSEILTEGHGYTLIHPDADTNAAILNTEATLAQLKTLFLDVLPNRIRPTCHDRLFIYFAGHGITRQVDDQGPQGFLVPQDADTNNCESLFPMGELYDALNQLECRHLFVVLDCCFAGMFRWASTRKVVLVPDEIHWEHYHRFIKYPAWQVITSAAHNQEALDYLDNRAGDTATRDTSSSKHSPFAEALFEGLQDQKADLVPDGVITAAELYLYLRDYVEKHSNEKQTPGFWPLNKHDRGEYIFQLVPEEQLTLKAAPKLEKDNNPYRGLEAFEEKHAGIFFGRDDVIDELVAHISVPARQFTVVDGASGSGKSSLVKAGLLSKLKAEHYSTWHVFPPIRPGSNPYRALACALLPVDTNPQDINQASEALKDSPETFISLIEAWSQLHVGKQLLLVIDQFEELITLAPKRSQSAGQSKWRSIIRGRRFDWQPPAQNRDTKPQWQAFTENLAKAIESCPQLQILVTLRSDFAPRFKASALGPMWADARFWVRPMRSDELREAVIGPANEMALYFEPANLVNTLVDDVVQTPGALPLISFTLSELYLKLYSGWNREGKDDRALSVGPDFYGEGGVAGLLAKRANEEYDQLPDDAHRRTMQHVILRMVEIEGSESVKRRVSKKELLYVNAQENERVETVLARLDRARLIVSGSEAGEVYIEPAHDYLVRGWDRLQDWIQSEQETLLLQRLLIPAVNNWSQTKRDLWNGNSRLTLLKQIRKSRNNWLNQLEMLFIKSSVNRKRLNIGSRVGFVGLVAVVGTVLSLKSDYLMAVTLQKLAEVNESLDETAEQLKNVSTQNVEYQIQYDETLQNLGEVTELADQEARAKQVALEQAKAEEEKTKVATQLAQDNYASAQRNAVNQLSATAKLFMQNRKPTEAMVYAISAADLSRRESLWEESTLPSTVPVNLLTALESSREVNVFEVPMADGVENAALEDAAPENAALENVSSASSEFVPSEFVPSESVGYASAIASNGDIISGNPQGDIYVWQAKSQDNKPIDSLQLSGGGRVREFLMTAADDTFVWLEDGNSTTIALIEKGEKGDQLRLTKAIKPFENEQRPVSVAIAPNSQTIAIVNQVGTLTVLDNKGTELWSEPKRGMDTISSVAISPEGETVVVAGIDNDAPTLQIWNQKTLKKTVAVTEDSLLNYSAITAVKISPDGQNIVVVGDDDAKGNSHIHVRDVDGAVRNHPLMATAGKINQISVTKAGNILATVNKSQATLSAQSAVYLWSIEGARLLDEVVEWEVLDAAIAPDGETIVLSSVEESKNKLHVWEGAQRQSVAQYFDLSAVSNAKSGSAKPASAKSASAKSASAKPASAKSASPEQDDIDILDGDASEAAEPQESVEEAPADAENAIAPESLETAKVAAAEESTDTKTSINDDDGTDDTSPDAASSDASPEAVSPDDASSDAASRDDDSSDAVSSDAVSLDDSSPEAVSPDDVSPDDVSPDDAASSDASPEAVSPDDASSDAASPDDSSPEAVSPDDDSSNAASPDDDSSDAVSPDAVPDDKAIADEPDSVRQRDPQTTADANEKNNTALQPVIQESLAQALIAVTPDGKTVAIGENSVVDGKNIHRLKVQKTDVSSSLLEDELNDLDGEIHSLSISNSGQKVAVVIKAGKPNSYYVKILNVETGKFVSGTIPLKEAQVFAQISPDGQTLFSAISRKNNQGKYTSKVQSWNLAQVSAPKSYSEGDPQPIHEQAVVGEVSAIAISEAGDHLMIAHNKGFDDTSAVYKFGGNGTLTVWDVSSAGVGEEGFVEKDTIATKGYISAIALSSTQQEVALITHHAKRQRRRADREQAEKIGVEEIVSKVKIWTWEGRRVSQTFNLGQGKMMQFIGLMPDGKNIIVGGHDVVSLAYRVGEQYALSPAIRLLNKQSGQISELSWAAALSADKTKDATEAKTAAKTERVAEDAAYQARLTSLVVTTDGKHIFSGIRQPTQLGIIRWDLGLETLLQASCRQMRHHPLLYRSTPDSKDVDNQAQSACKPFSAAEDA